MKPNHWLPKLAVTFVIALGLFITFAACIALAGGPVGDGSSGSCTEATLTTALSGGGTITLACGGPKYVNITSVKIITQNTTIDGGHQITLTGGFLHRLFIVTFGVTLTARNIVLDGGQTPAANGGTIVNLGTLQLENSTVQ
jgi:hypothetical protein